LLITVKTCSPKLKAYKRAWYAKNKAHCRAYRKKWLKKNPARTKGYRKRWARDCKKLRSDFRDVVNKIKHVPCTDCGVKYPPRVMEFDHLEPEQKKFTVSREMGRANTRVGQARILEEIKKCEVVCSNCHRLREIKRDALQ